MDTPNSATRERLSKLKEYQSRLKEYQSKQSDYQSKLTEIRGVPRHLPDFRLRAEELQKIRADLDALGDVLRASKKDYEHITGAIRAKYLPMVEPLFPLAIAARELQRTIQEALQSYSEPFKALQQVVEEWRKQAETLRQGFAQLTQPLVSLRELFRTIPPEKLEILSKNWASVISDFQKHLDNRDKRAFHLLAKRGWIGLEDHLTSDAIDRLMRLDKSGGARAVDGFVCRFFRVNNHKRLRQMVRGWRHTAYLKRRRRITRHALKAHMAKLFALSVPSLLPLVDGLTARIVGRTPDKQRAVYAPNAAAQYHLSENEPWSECLLAVITKLMYKKYDFSKKAPSTINRHAIIHGEVIGYDTEANSLRVFLLVDAFARLLGAGPIEQTTSK